MIFTSTFSTHFLQKTHDCFLLLKTITCVSEEWKSSVYPLWCHVAMTIASSLISSVPRHCKWFFRFFTGTKAMTWFKINDKSSYFCILNFLRNEKSRNCFILMCMARLSSQYSNNLNIQSITFFCHIFYFLSVAVLFCFFIFHFASIVFYISSYYFIYTCLAHLFFILYSLSYMRSIFFIFIPYFFLFREGFFIFFLISMQHVITWPRCTFPTISKAKWRMEL